MPRATRYRSPAFEELEKQLAFAPPEALRRQMEAAEKLVDEVDDAATYPFEFVQWRVTGFRTSNAAMKSCAAEPLRADLVTFVLHISERLDLRADDRPGGALALTDAAVELAITEKTLRRWRTRGLLCHRIALPDGRNRVAIFRGELERFARRNPGLLTDAAQFTRLDDPTSVSSVARIRALVAQGMTPNRAAKAVAKDIGRSHETVRQLLLRSADDQPVPIGTIRRAEGVGRDRRFAYRAWRFGVAIERLAERSGAKPDAIRRRIDHARADRLRALRFTWIAFPTFGRSDAEQTILAAPAASTDLAPHHEPIEAVGLLDAIAAEKAPTGRQEAAEEAMLAAYNLLKRRARHLIEHLARAPDRLTLDRIEIDLLWALRLKRRLVERWLTAAVARTEQAIGGPLVRRPAEEIRTMLERCVSVVDATIETADPSKRQSARRLIALETDLALARLGVAPRAPRASVRHERGSQPLPRLFDRLVSWGDLVDRLAVKRGALGRLTAIESALLARRHGWDGGPPRTLEELAAQERTTVARITRRMIDAETALRVASRIQRAGTEGQRG
ncbi:MAG: hypothetical protein SGJ11_18375 [Phycisphaerae bacterium]|nr:hypothetical protein [Phycisphaerae bacterium]